MSTVSSFFEDGRPKPKGAVLFTGPDGVRDHRVTVEEQFYVGHGSMSPEASSNTEYICRAAPDIPHPPPKTARVGEIGWGIPNNTDYSLLKSGNQIMLKQFRQANEDRYTHRYQEPYYPPPPPTSSSHQTSAAMTTTGGGGINVDSHRLYIKRQPNEEQETLSTHSSHTSI